MKTAPTTLVMPGRPWPANTAAHRLAAIVSSPAGSSHGRPATAWSRCLPALLAAWMLVGGAVTGRAASASPADYMTYQGFLVDANGAPLASTTPANYPANFRIFNAATGGTLIWSEFQIITVDRGQFSVVLGEGTAITGEPAGQRPALSQVFTNTFASDLYMEIQVSINGTPNTILPRLRLVTSPFAFLSAGANRLVAPNNGLTYLSYNAGAGRTEVNGNLYASGTITGNGGGLTNLNVGSYVLSATNIASGTLNDARLSANVARRNTGNAFSGGHQTMTGGNLGVGTTSPNFPVSLGSSLGNTKLALWENGPGVAYGMGVQGSQFRLHLNGQAADRFSFLNGPAGSEVATLTHGGRLGIGTTTPTEPLDVQGNAKVSGTMTLGTNNLRAVGSTETLRIIRGYVAENGSIVIGSGTGFTVRKLGLGWYAVEFYGGSFTGLPVVTVSIARSKETTYDLILRGSGANTSFELKTLTYNGSVYTSTDREFMFIAVGPQ